MSIRTAHFLGTLEYPPSLKRQRRLSERLENHCLECIKDSLDFGSMYRKKQTYVVHSTIRIA